MKQLIIDEKLFNIFPSATIGVLRLSNVNNTKSEEAEFFLREGEQFARKHHSDKALLDLPEMKAWREAYKTLGVKKGNRVSMESLIKRVIKGNDLPIINPLVDIYNSISLRHVFPCGGEDLRATKGNIHLTFANGDETFYQIGSDTSEPPEIDEVVYKDDLGCLCRRWNWREADRTKLTEETTDAILVVESLSSERIDDMNQALKDLEKLCKQFLGAEVKKFILSKDNLSCEL